MDAVGMLGSPTASAIFMAAILAAAASRLGILAALVIGMSMALLLFVEGILRIRIDVADWRDVPQLLLYRHEHLVQSTYPSGHVARFLLLSGAAVTLLGAHRRLAVCLVIVLGVVIGVQRIASGAHTASDVVGGALLGGGLAAATAAAIGRLNGRDLPLAPWWERRRGTQPVDASPVPDAEATARR
jgi:membrane-associated phospholipid phosphatase